MSFYGELLLEAVVALAGVWIALIFVAVAAALRSSWARRILVGAGVVFLVLQGGCCMVLAAVGAHLGGGGGGLMLPLSLAGVVVFVLVARRVLRKGPRPK
jgi:hypothetical protein